ncbi:MAG: proton-conducting transporter membrane subunit [bacterium]|nr:proton-conducting transporter membrane subunit [bacterium]
MGSHLQVLIPVTLILGAFLIPILERWFRKLLEPLVIGITFFCLIYSCLLLYGIYLSPLKVFQYFVGFSWNAKTLLITGEPIGIVLQTDLIGGFILVLINFISFLAAIYSLRYVPQNIPDGKKGVYYTLFLLMTAGMSGICLTGDIFNLYVLFEVANLSSYALVSIDGEAEAVEAAIKYLLISALASIFIFFGIGLLYGATGTLNMSYASNQIRKVLLSGHDTFLFSYRYLIFASLALFTAGFGIKSALVPVHGWLPDAHSKAPSPISAMLSGLLIKVTGIFLFIRFYFSVFRIQDGLYGDMFPAFILSIGAISAISGSVFAIAQKNLKRMLAFSTVSQMGYILIGIGFFSRDGLTGAVLHLFNHSVMKSALFLSAGAIFYKTKFTRIDELKGLGFKMPVTCACFTIAALGMVGIPPMSGFFSKWILGIAAIRAGFLPVSIIFLLGSLLNAIYYFRVIGKMYFFNRDSLSVPAPEAGMRELPESIYIPIAILAFAVLFFGLGSDILLKIIRPGVEYLWK